ncbi:MAG TPA: hypothetical protein DCM02_11605, partial [Flavobacterium sp.]|nr:hypothetical protein [Flavobacterium sp.]
QLEELKKTETVLSGSASFSEIPEQTFSENINNTNTELFRQSLSDLIIVTKQNVNLTLPEREAFANQFESIKNEITSTKVKNETINKYQEIAKELDKKLLINAIEKGQFQYYGSLEQKVEVSKYLVESLRNDLVNASQEEQTEILKAVNYWEQTYNDLRNESVEETLKERTEQELQALNLILLLADAPVEVVSEVALSKLSTLAGSAGITTLELINKVPILKTVFGRILVLEEKFGGFSKEILSQNAAKLDRNGLTKAGRAIQKHSDRLGSAYSYSSKKPDILNAEGQKIVDEILNNPQSIVKPNKFGGIDIISPNEKGVSYSADGSMRGFLEPNTRRL